MHYTALNIYLQGNREQSRLITDCMGPAFDRLWQTGAVRRLWFLRFDLRGPHVTFLIGTPSDRTEQVRSRIATLLDGHLSDHPGTGTLSDAELEARHAACLGPLCAVDRLPGMARNGSYAVADDRPDGYPFGYGAGIADTEALDRVLGELTLWTIGKLRAGTSASAAVSWAAAVTAALERAGADPAAYWQAYASTLFIGDMRERILAADPELVDALPRLIGPRNCVVLSRAWDQAEQSGSGWPGADALARLAVSDRAGEPAPRRGFVRELAHGVFSQLDQNVNQRIPLVLYAWERTRTDAPRSEPVPA